MVSPVCLAALDQVARHFGLAVDGDVLAGQPGEIDAVQPVVEGEREAVMRQPLGMQPRADAGLVEQVDRALLEHAGAHAAEHMLAARRARG